MADVLHNVHFLPDNTHTTGHIVANPTYGVSWRDSTDMLSDIAESIDYQSVSAVNPHYSTVDLSKKTKYRSASPQENVEEESGIPIPGRSQNTNTVTDGNSGPKGNSFLNSSPTNIQNGGSSLSSSFPSCGSPMPLLLQSNVPQNVMGSQASQRSDSSSNSESGMEKRPLQAQVTFSDYSYARHPSISSTNSSRVRNVSESQSVGLLSTQTSRIEEESEEDIRTTAFVGKNDESDPQKIEKNISYGRYRVKQYGGDRLKIHDFTTTIDVVIAIFAVVSLVISLVVIILFIALLVRLNNSKNTIIGMTTIVDQSTLDSNGTTLGQCDCPVIDQVNQLETKLNELGTRLQNLKKNVSLPVLVNRLSGLIDSISSLNQTVIDLKQTANETVPKTDDLQLSANVKFNNSHHHDCIVEHTSTCSIPSSSKYLCRTSGIDFVVDNMVVVDFNCYATSPNDGFITTEIAIELNDFDADLRSQLFTAKLSCFCVSYDKTSGDCNIFFKRCPYTSSSIPASFIT